MIEPERPLREKPTITMATPLPDRQPRDTRKKDVAPRGVFRHRSGLWGIRFTCGAGHVHEEKVSPVKGDASRAHATRRQRAYAEPGWCPAIERRQARERAQVEAERERQRVTFKTYAQDYLAAWTQGHLSHKTAKTEVDWLAKALGERALESIAAPDIEELLAGLRAGRSPSGRALSGAAVNRYRDRLSGMFKRALRLGLVVRNPVTGIPKHRESAGRIAYLTAEDEAAVREALPPALQPAFTAAVNLGLRLSEQRRLTWQDVDMLTGSLAVRRTKNGRPRAVPMNSVVRRLLVDLGTRRARPDDSQELVFRDLPRDASKFLPAAVKRAQVALRANGMDATGLDGVTWHTCRHTFASRLVMAGVDLRTVQELGGWRTLALVTRYAHMQPDHLRDAVERLVYPGAQMGQGRSGTWS
jgi:integrase